MSKQSFLQDLQVGELEVQGALLERVNPHIHVYNFEELPIKLSVMRLSSVRVTLVYPQFCLYTMQFTQLGALTCICTKNWVRQGNTVEATKTSWNFCGSNVRVSLSYVCLLYSRIKEKPMVQPGSLVLPIASLSQSSPHSRLGHKKRFINDHKCSYCVNPFVHFQYPDSKMLWLESLCLPRSWHFQEKETIWNYSQPRQPRLSQTLRACFALLGLFSGLHR